VQPPDATDDYVFPPPRRPALPVRDSQAKFPVRRIYCIGRNYADHAREMGHDPEREPPFFFQKNPDSLVPVGEPFRYPPGTANVHFEVEMVVALGKGGRDIPAARGLDHVYGYAVGLDMTRRDLQAEAKKLGRPWEIAKAFDGAAPCSALVPASRIGHPQHGRIWLTQNGVVRQDGNIDQMIWKVPEMIACLSSYFALRPGDLIYSGTPAGVGAVVPGDHLSGGVEGVAAIDVQIA
jgi:fumarylpyruvate hydrolase